MGRRGNLKLITHWVKGLKHLTTIQGSTNWRIPGQLAYQFHLPGAILNKPWIYMIVRHARRDLNQASPSSKWPLKSACPMLALDYQTQLLSNPDHCFWFIFFAPGGRVPGLGRPQVRAPQWGTPCVDWSRCSARPGSCKAWHSDRRTQEIPCSGTWILDFLITRVRITSEKDSCGLLLHSTWKYFPCKLHKPFLIDCFSKQTFTLFKSCLRVVILFATVKGWCSAILWSCYLANSQ